MLGCGSLRPRWAPHQLSPAARIPPWREDQGCLPAVRGAVSKASGMRCVQDTSPSCSCLFLQPQGSQPPDGPCFQTQGGGSSLLKAELFRDVLGWDHFTPSMGLALRLSPAPQLACP